MGLHYNSERMRQWRKEVQDFLGFELRIPEYSKEEHTFEEHAPFVLDIFFWFYDSQEKLLCRLKHSDFRFPNGGDDSIPGVPDSFGSDEDWDREYSNQCPPVFKGFPWSFNLQFFDEQGRVVTDIEARRTFQNDDRPMIHMAWYLTRWKYDPSGKSDRTYTFKYFDWELS